MNEIISTGLPFAAIAVSLVALFFSRKSWLASNRPLVSARVTANGMGGNVATPLSLVVENTGNRPATNIVLRADPETYAIHFRAQPDDVLRKAVERTLSEWSKIPVLANGRSVTTSFGLTSDNEQATWEPRARFDIRVEYSDFDKRKYKHAIPLLIADDQGFGGGIWRAPAPLINE
jgi:hypothetical protein